MQKTSLVIPSYFKQVCLSHRDQKSWEFFFTFCIMLSSVEWVCIFPGTKHCPQFDSSYYFVNQGVKVSCSRTLPTKLPWPLTAQCRGGCLMVSMLDSVTSSLHSNPGQGHCVVFLGKTLYSYSASLHPGV